MSTATPVDPIRNDDDALTAANAIEEALAGGMPTTPGILLTLHDLWVAAGDSLMAGTHLMALSSSITEASGLEMASGVRTILASSPHPPPGVKEEIDRLEALIRSNRRRLLLTSIPLDERRIHKFDLAREVMLATRLYRSKVMLAKEFAGILLDICSYPLGGVVKPATVLHSVHDQAMPCEQKVMEYLVNNAGLPYISLSCFSLRPEAALTLHVEFMKHRAALVFETIGPDALVAILNPYNEKLKQDVALVTQLNCHFFLVSPGEYDRGLETALQLANQSVVNIMES